MPQFAERIFPILTAALSALCIWGGIDVLLHQTAYQTLSAAVAFVSAFGLAIAALAVWFDIRGRRGIAIFCGCCLILVTVSRLTLGRDSLEGVTDAFVLIVGAIAGVLAFSVGKTKRPHDAT